MTDVLPFGFKKKMARVRTEYYEWFEPPREADEPLGVLEFKKRSDCGRSDKGESIAACIAEAVTELQGRYKTRTRTRKTPDVWEADDAEWVEDAGDSFEQAERLLSDFPDVFHKHIAAFATVNCGRYNDGFYRLYGGAFSDANGVFLLTHEELKVHSPSMYTPTGRPRKGVFRRFKNDDLRTFDAHVESLVHAVLSEYIAWANNSAVELHMQLLDDSECLCVDLPLGIATHVTDDMTEAFEDNAESTFSGPWYEVNGRFNAYRMVSDALPSAWKSVGVHRFQSGYDVHEYLVTEFSHGYAEEAWTYFVYPEHIGSGEQLSLDLQPPV